MASSGGAGAAATATSNRITTVRSYDFVVVGGGSVGLALAVGLRKHLNHASVLLVTEDDFDFGYQEEDDCDEEIWARSYVYSLDESSSSLLEDELGIPRKKLAPFLLQQHHDRCKQRHRDGCSPLHRILKPDGSLVVGVVDEMIPPPRGVRGWRRWRRRAGAKGGAQGEGGGGDEPEESQGGRGKFAAAPCAGAGFGRARYAMLRRDLMSLLRGEYGGNGGGEAMVGRAEEIVLPSMFSSASSSSTSSSRKRRRHRHDISDCDRRVLLRVRKPDGTSEEVCVKWLFGCDGIRSAVRTSLATRYDGNFRLRKVRCPSSKLLYKSLWYPNPSGATMRDIVTVEGAKRGESLTMMDFPVAPDDGKRRGGGRCASSCGTRRPVGTARRSDFFLYECRTVEEFYDAANLEFPQLDIRDRVSESEVISFLAEPPVVFSDVAYSGRAIHCFDFGAALAAARDPPGSGGGGGVAAASSFRIFAADAAGAAPPVGFFRDDNSSSSALVDVVVDDDEPGDVVAAILLGDALHHFPPDVRNGLDSGLADVRRVLRTVRQVDKLGALVDEYIGANEEGGDDAGEVRRRVRKYRRLQLKLKRLLLTELDAELIEEAEAVCRLMPRLVPYQYNLRGIQDRARKLVFDMNNRIRASIYSNLVQEPLFYPPPMQRLARYEGGGDDVAAAGTQPPYSVVWKEQQWNDCVLSAAAVGLSAFVAFVTRLWLTRRRRHHLQDDQVVFLKCQ